MCPRSVVPDQPFTVVMLMPDAMLFSSFRLLSTFPDPRAPSQLFHGAGADFVELPKFTKYDRVSLSVTSIENVLKLCLPMLSVATTLIGVHPMSSAVGLATML